MNHYETLGVPVGAPFDMIRTAYRTRARSAHPDATGSADRAEMGAINEAWFVLADPDRRRRYDARLGVAPADEGHRADDTAWFGDDHVGSPATRTPRNFARMLVGTMLFSAAAFTVFLLIALLQGH